jgi:glyoxylase I family protein
MIQGFDHVAIAVSDMVRAVDFYCGLLGMRRVDSRDPSTTSYFWLNFGVGQNLTLSLSPDGTPKGLGLIFDYPRTPHIAFVAPEDAISELKQRLQNHGVEVYGSGSEIYFIDPDGNGIEITCWRETGLREAGKSHW